MIYVANAFSLQMLESWRLDMGATVSARTIVDPAAWLADAEARHGAAVSAVGHADTAAVFSAVLGRDVPAQRVSVTLTTDDELLIGQVVGGRLPEGATTLPDGVSIRWLLITVED